MRYNINKKDITMLLESGFMLGVNKGFHDSPLPEFAVKNYSDLSTLKNNKKSDDVAIAQDLVLRMGSQALSKATVGGLTYAAVNQAQQLADLDVSDHASLLINGVPAVAAAWMASDMLNKKIPKLHQNALGNKSIYKKTS